MSEELRDYVVDELKLVEVKKYTTGERYFKSNSANVKTARTREDNIVLSTVLAEDSEEEDNEWCFEANGQMDYIMGDAKVQHLDHNNEPLGDSD